MVCIICPECGFRECGTNTCPECGISILSDGRVVRSKKAVVRCDTCGDIAFTDNYFCKCRGTYKPFDGDTHFWTDTSISADVILTCCGRDMIRSTVMRREVSQEIEYCPFCGEELTTRPEAIDIPQPAVVPIAVFPLLRR